MSTEFQKDGDDKKTRVDEDITSCDGTANTMREKTDESRCSALFPSQRNEMPKSVDLSPIFLDVVFLVL